MSQKVMIVTVGVAGAGKGQWARSTGLPLIMAATIRAQMRCQSVLPISDKAVYSAAKVAAAALLADGAPAVIVHAPNLTAWQRWDWGGRGWSRRFVVFDVNREAHLKSAADAGRSASFIEHLESQFGRFEPFNAAELGPGELVVAAAEAASILPAMSPAIDIAGIRREAAADVYRRARSLVDSQPPQAGRELGLGAAFRQVLAAEGIDIESIDAELGL